MKKNYTIKMKDKDYFDYLWKITVDGIKVAIVFIFWGGLILGVYLLIQGMSRLF